MKIQQSSPDRKTLSRRASIFLSVVLLQQQSRYINAI